MSARASTLSALRACSGAMYSAVPMTTPATVRFFCCGLVRAALAMPKSMSLSTARPEANVTNTFSGLRSRWMTPSACAASSASRICWV